MSDVPKIVWDTIAELGGKSSVQGLVLTLIGELCAAWEREVNGQAMENAARAKCAAQLRERLRLLDRSKP